MRLEGVLGTSWRRLGGFMRRLEAKVGRLGRFLAHLGGILGPSWGVLGGLGRVLGVSWRHLGGFFGCLGGVCSRRLAFYMIFRHVLEF